MRKTNEVAKAGLSGALSMKALLVFTVLVISVLLQQAGSVSSADFSGGTVTQGENKIVHSTGAVVLESTNYVAGADRSGWFAFNFNATPKVDVSAVDLVVVSGEDIQAEIDVWENASRTYNATSCSQSGVVFANGTAAQKTVCTNSSSTVVGFNWSLVTGTESWSSGKKEVRFGPLSAKVNAAAAANVRIRNFPRGNVYKFDFCLVPSGVNLSVARDNGLGGCLDPSAQGQLKENLWLDFCGGNTSDSSGNKLQFQLTGSLAYSNWSFGCAAEFNPDVGGNDYLRNDTSLSSLLKYDLPNAYTITGWFYSDDNGVQNHFWEAGNSEMALTFMDAAEGAPNIGKVRAYHSPGTVNTFPGVYPVGTWEFTAVTYNTTHTIVYRNTTASSPVVFTSVQPYTAVTVGALVSQAAGYFDGKIANYRHYNFSLNSTEISLLFDGGNGTNKSLETLVNPPPSFVNTPSVNVSIINRTSSNASVILASEHLWGSANYSDFDLHQEVNSTFKWYTNNTNQSWGGGNRTTELKALIYKGALAYWHLDGTGNDSSGNNIPLNVSGAFDYDSGRINQGLNLSSQARHHANASSPLFNFTNSNFTMSAWVKIRPTISNIPSIIYEPVKESYWLRARNDNSWEFALVNRTDGVSSASAANSIRFDTWTFLVGTYNGTHLALYVDGERVDADPLLPPLKETTFDLIIGREQIDNPPRFFNGSIDEVGIWNRSLTPQEIKQLYLRSWYDYSPQQFLLQPYATNSTGLNSSDGEAPMNTAGTISNVSGYHAGTYGVNISNGYINYSNNGSQNFNEKEGTVEFWIQSTRAGNDGVAVYYLTSKIVDDFTVYKNAGNNLRVYMNNPGATMAQSDISGWAAGSWHHVAATWNNHTSNVTLHVDGVQVANSGTAFAIPKTPSFYLGSYESNGVALPCNCTFSDFRLSRKALTAQEINESFSKGRAFFQNEYLLNSSNYLAGDTLKLEYSPKDSVGTVGAAQNSSSLNVHAIQMANEAEGDIAIEKGINSSLSSATKYSEQQVYVRNLSNNHTLGRFDWVASFGSQRWLINYITAGESSVNAPNLTTAVYVLEIAGKTSAQITDEVSRFINATKSS